MGSNHRGRTLTPRRTKARKLLEIEQYSRGFSISTARSIVNWIRNYLLESQGNHFHRAANEMGSPAAEKEGNSQFSAPFLFNSTEYETEKHGCLFAVKKKVQRFYPKTSFWGQSEGHPNCEPSLSLMDADQMSSNRLFAFTSSDSPCNRLLSMLNGYIFLAITIKWQGIFVVLDDAISTCTGRM